MPPRDDLVRRLDRLLVLDPRIVAKRMFGGVCFLMDGKILVCARGKGGLLVQCGAAAADAVEAEAGVERMIMRGRPTANFISVDNDSLETDEGLRRWIELAAGYLSALESKDA